MGDFPILDMGENTDKLELGIDNDFGEGIDGLAMAMDIQEKRFILKALSQYRWHKGKTADALKIDPKTLYIKMKKFGIS